MRPPGVEKLLSELDEVVQDTIDGKGFDLVRYDRISSELVSIMAEHWKTKEKA